MNIETEIEKKKKRLNSFHRVGIRILQLEDQLEEMKLNKISPSSTNDGMPKGNDISDLSDYAANMEKIEQSIKELKRKRNCIYRDITKRINAMENVHEKKVLKYKYIRGMDWERIVVNTEKSYRQVLRIHGRALKNFPLK